jgi:hypothetical protein
LVVPGTSDQPCELPNKLFTIGRATYALRRSDYLGAIYTHTNYDGRDNLVAGGDLSFRPSSTQSINATFLSSRTTDRVNPTTQGTAAQASFGYETRRVGFVTQVEHYDREFQMDTAFFNRTGFTSGWLFANYSFYPKQGTDFWIQRVHPFVFTKIGHDDIQDGREAFVNTGIRMNLTRDGFTNLFSSRGYEPWQGQRYDVGARFGVYAQQQVVRWLRLYGEFNKGPAIFYDLVDPFQGQQRFIGGGLTLQPNQNLTQTIDFRNVYFERDSTREQVYDVKILNTRTTYQFNKHFLIRFLAQYDSSAKRVLTDLLASYELVPGTVFHVGYGSLYEKDREFPGAPPQLNNNYLMVNRGLFLKASYVHRF